MKELIEDLRLNHEFCPKDVILRAADALERLTAELEATKKAVQQNYFRVVEVTVERDLLLEQMTADRKQYLDIRDERNALKADAERYRYLAKTANGYDKKEKLDAHIDSAIQGAKHD